MDQGKEGDGKCSFSHKTFPSADRLWTVVQLSCFDRVELLPKLATHLLSFWAPPQVFPSPWHAPAEDDETSIFDEHKIEEADRRQQGESLSSISLSIERLLLNIDNCLILMDSTSNGWFKLPFNFSQLVWHSDILNQATYGCWMPPLPRMIFKPIRILCPAYFPGNRPVNRVYEKSCNFLLTDTYRVEP